MASLEQLPLELKLEIFSRLPPQSLVQFRSVSKQWNSLLKDKSFVDFHFSRSRPHLFVYDNYKAYLIDIMALDPNSIAPSIYLRDLPSYDDPFQDTMQGLRTCDESLFCIYLQSRRMGFWNPWLRQVKLFEYDVSKFFPFGLGYDNSKPEKAYKVLGMDMSDFQMRAAIYDCASQVYKFIDQPYSCWDLGDRHLNVCLNGYLYWVSPNDETHEYYIQIFDFSIETLEPFCLLPFKKSHCEERLVLEVFEADRFSLLKQSFLTKNIEIWVTKKKICSEEKDVAWIKLMTLPTTNFPRLIQEVGRISYFIHKKTLFMCCTDHETRFVCIYIVRENLCKRIEIGYGIRHCHHSFYTPSLISVPYFRD